MKKVLTMAVIGLCVITSCSDKKGDGTKLSPAENKAKLEQIGLDLAALVDADAFNDFTNAVSYLTDELPELPFFVVNEDEPGITPGEEVRPASAIMQVATPLFAGQLAAVTAIVTRAARAADYNVADYYGIFTFTDGEWVETTSTERFEVSYQYNGQTVKIVAKADPAAKVYPVSYNGETAEIPAKIAAEMTMGTTRLVDVTVDIPALAENLLSGEVKVAVAIAGYNVDATAKVSDKSASATAAVKKGSALLVSANASGTGSGLTSTDYDNYDPKIDAVNGTVGIMDQAYLKVSSPNVQRYIDGMEELREEYRPNSTSSYIPYDEDYATRATKLFNDNYTIFMNYDNSANATASYQHKVVLVKDDYSTWTNEVGYITFPEDGSRYTLENYFNEDDFKKVIDAFEDIADKFEAMVQ